MAGEDGPFGPRGASDGRRTGVVSARLGSGITVRVVPELAEHPGAEYITESWYGEVDVGVRVLLKMGTQFGFESGDLRVEFGNDPQPRRGWWPRTPQRPQREL